jgi:branched-chain amino acid transport system ATP-binding protein
MPDDLQDGAQAGFDDSGRRDESAKGGRSPVLLEARGVSKRYGGLQALTRVSLAVGGSESVGLVGPNGAGKTTLFNCICGTEVPDGGSIWMDGRRIDGMDPFRRARLGLGRTYQRIEVFPELSVREHVLVAERARRGDGRLWKDLLNRGAPTEAEMATADAVLELVGLSESANAPVAALSLGTCRLVELARALVRRPRILLADEPSSGLDVYETRTLGSVLRRVQREQGMAVLLVEHDLRMVAQVVDRVVVLDFGRQVAEGPLGEVMADPAVRSAYLGKSA